MSRLLQLTFTAMVTTAVAALAHAAERPIKTSYWLASPTWSAGGTARSSPVISDAAREYLDNLKSVVAAARKDTGAADLPFIYGTTRIEGIPDDLTDFEEPKNLPPGRPGAWLVLKAQFDAQKEIPHSKMVILRDLEKHPRNVHYNTAGQLVVGKLFAEAFLAEFGESLCCMVLPPSCRRVT